ncbi:uncharacterized protein LTR77_009524 [Saxophila tyrrhenica]|uniref:Uncharacterized protein n=1 Tax=Saxophila tyrrhenica TaxID=1690608 RepID=A0AAV9P207_9PEZI|nr:hypothetical protein LTR77_009524 [Saxophila tyrrhenica]
MSLSPNISAAGRFIGHRRGRSSAVDIQINGLDEPQEKTSEGLQPLLEHEKYDRLPERRPRNNAFLAALWAASLIFTCLITWLLTRLYYDRASEGFAAGFPTELRAARSAISTSIQQFTGSLDFNGHHGFVPPDSPSLAYMGSGPSIDAAWDTLTADRYFLLTDDEAREAYGADPAQYWNVHHGGYVAGLDVLHSLHCVNHLRMSLYPDVYPQDPVDGVMQ